MLFTACGEGVPYWMWGGAPESGEAEQEVFGPGCRGILARYTSQGCCASFTQINWCEHELKLAACCRTLRPSMTSWIS